MTPRLTIEEFGDFFEAIHGPGARPYRWQEELLGELATTGRWPDQIAAPTGAGKSAVVEIHVFATALAAVGGAPRLPRRLAVVVNRRALTDAHADRARRIQGLLADSGAGSSILGRVREALASLRVRQSPAVPLVVATMRGAAAVDRDWLNDPEACAVLCMTPAMWASSILFRSYGAGPLARPRLAGLLALDSAVVVDEAHLSRQLVTTARRAGELAAPSAEQLGVPGLQVVEMTATPTTSHGHRAGVTEGSLVQDERLRRRMLAHKGIRYVEAPSWPPHGRMTAGYRDVVADEVMTAVDRARATAGQGAAGSQPRTPVGCVLNRVDSAVQVAGELRRRGLRCAVWVGRMRPADLERLRDPGTGAVGGHLLSDVDVLVATQTVEVGIDLDLASLVTELAPGTALAQRAGRVNRAGIREGAEVVVVGPPADLRIVKDVPPYGAQDLESGRQWAASRAAAGDLSPLAVSADPPPSDTPRRVLWQRPEPWNLDLWARTSTPLLVEPELDLWIRDDLEPEAAMAGVVLRDLAGLPDAVACETLLMAVPPTDRETYPVPFGEARSLIERILAQEQHPLERSVLWREGEPVTGWQAIVSQGAGTDVALRPGDVLVLDPSVPLLAAEVVAAEGEDRGVPILRAVDTIEAPDPSAWSPTPDAPISIILDRDALRRLASLSEQDIVEMYPGSTVSLPAVWDDDEGPAWLVISREETVDDDSDQRSTWSRKGRVLLDAHNGAVAERATCLGLAVGLHEPLPAVLSAAGSWHDVGKGDLRFQRMLAGGPVDSTGPALAKSRRTLPSIRRAWAQAGLPPSWRHELASAASYWSSSEAAGTAPSERDLVTRLIGTSHGHGRPTFRHGPVTAGPGWGTALEELVGEGEWESVVTRTDRLLGPWGTAYLEALLRAADCTISEEGR